MDKPQLKKGPKKPQLEKKPRNLNKGGISAEELERRLKQRENALMRRFASASSQQLVPALRSAKTTLRGAKELLEALIDPGSAKPFRLPGGGRPTFVNKLHYVQALQVAPASAAGLLTPNSGFAVVRRDPRCALIYSFYQPVSATSIYELQKADSSVALPASGSNGYLIFTVAGYLGGVQTHGQYMVAWVFEDGLSRAWFQNEAANTSSVTVSALTPSVSYQLTVNFLFQGTQTTVVITATTDGSGNGVFQLPATNYVGYAAFRIATNAAPTTYLSIPNLTMNDNSSMKVAHLALPQFWTNYQDIDSLRVNAASLMLSDRTSEQYSQGDCVAYQAAGNDEWAKMLGATSPTSFGLDPYTPVTVFQDMYEGRFQKGRYIPLKFTDDQRELDLIPLAEAGNAWDIPPISFQNQRDYLYVSFNVGTLGGTVPSPTGKWTANFGVEGECESQWRETCVPQAHPDVLKEAKWCFSQVKCNFENPSHLARIWNWVKTNAPHILDAVDMIAPILPPQVRVPVMTGSAMARGALKYVS